MSVDRNTPLPGTEDARNVDPEIGVLSGEASTLSVSEIASSYPAPMETRRRLPIAHPDEETPTYYDQPAIKEPVWIWSIPIYFYVGGAAGAASALAAAANALDARALRGLVGKARWMGAIGDVLGGALLTYDLGRPARLFNMLRVFRPTSPMSIGSWVLAGSGATNGIAALLSSATGPLASIGDAAGLAGGFLGLPLTGYTAVLIANTAVPVWLATRRSLPPFFVASAAAGAASVLDLFPLRRREQRVVRLFGLAARAMELVAGVAVEREARRIERVGRPLRAGFSGALWKTSKLLAVVALGLSLAPAPTRRRQRWLRFARGGIGTAAALAGKCAVFYAGKASARDPRATFLQQHREGSRFEGEA